MALHAEILQITVHLFSSRFLVSKTIWTSRNDQANSPTSLHLLAVMSPDHTYLQVSIQNVHCDIQCFLKKLEALLYLNQPVHQNGTHGAVDVTLIGQIVFLDMELDLCKKKKNSRVTTNPSPKSKLTENGCWKEAPLMAKLLKSAIL